MCGGAAAHQEHASEYQAADDVRPHVVPPFTKNDCTSRSVVLAVVSGHVLTRHPAHCPARRPLPCISTQIVDRDLVLERVEIGPREFLNQSKLVGVRQAAVGEPEILVESRGVYHEGVTLPFSHRTPV